MEITETCLGVMHSLGALERDREEGLGEGFDVGCVAVFGATQPNVIVGGADPQR